MTPGDESTGGALFGEYDEEAGRESFAEALAEWRSTPSSQSHYKKAEKGGALLLGSYDEEANRQLFAQAVQEWRTGKTKDDREPERAGRSIVSQEQATQAQVVQSTQADRIAQQLAFMDSPSFLQRSTSDGAPNPKCFARK